MLFACGLDSDLAHVDAQRSHQVQRVAVGAAGSSESGHRDAGDTAARDVQLVEGAHRHEQRQRRIESSRYADDGRARPGVAYSLGQTADLDVEYFAAALVAARIVGRDERMRVERAEQSVGSGIPGPFHRDAPEGGGAAFQPECVGSAPHGLQPFDVYFANEQLFVEREAFRFAQHGSVFGDERIAGEDHIGRRLAESGRAVQVGRHSASRLLLDERAQVGVLAGHFVAGRQVDDQMRAGRGLKRRGRYGHPKVFAQFDAEAEGVISEKQSRRHRNPLPA